MKSLRIGLLLLASLVSSAGFADQKIIGTNKEPVSIFFIQRADRGSLVAVDNKPGEYQLRLSGVNEYIEYFSDRPVRLSGLYPTNEFITRWTDGNTRGSFKSLPPNAALSAIQKHFVKNKMVNVMLKLSNPIYDAQARTLTYTVHQLPGIKSGLPIKGLRNVVMFIDSYCVSCVSSGF